MEKTNDEIIKNAIEKYLGYQINNPIIYLEIE